MREIKFRAWDGKEMFEVAQITFNDGVWSISKGRSVSIQFQPHIILMQYTGLKDKNNKDIYEGDIVVIDHWKSSDLFDYSKPFIVTYYEGEINFKQGEYNNFKGSLQGKLSLEVIGNQYEHPSLINK